MRPESDLGPKSLPSRILLYQMQNFFTRTKRLERQVSSRDYATFANAETLRLWPLGTSEPHEFTGVEHGPPKSA
ncbi:hypothetical protein LWI28_014091 [Acer negundo]|uniref:Uncharacterized protein n=1 Tax=Acer negundo TaxID=4023 RepID=A0AAD5NNC3_ACENE|nr:hypothetical protein LWI28_014091 [Acer negundo]